LALAHGEAGAKTLDEVVTLMRKDLPEIDRDTVADAIVAFSRRSAPEAPPNKDEIKARVAELKKVARRDAALREQIEGLKNKAAKEKSPKEKKVYDERITALQKERAELQKGARAEGAEARMEERLTKEIDSLTEQIESGEFKAKPPKERRVYSDKIEALRAERDALRADASAVKLEAKFEERIKAQIADLTRQLETGEIKMPVPREKKVLTKRIEQLIYERDKAKADVKREIEKKKKSKGFFETVVGEPFDEVRAWWTTGEFSQVLRQGGFEAIANPQDAAKSIMPMLKAFQDPVFAHKFDLAIRPGNETSRPRAMEYEKVGLHLPDPEISSVRKRAEEAFQSDLPVTRAISRLTKIPIDKLPEKFGRAYISYLNMRRVFRYDALADTLPKGGEPTLEEGKAIAGFINAATGRGDLGTLNAAAKSLNAIFFAPRYVISRFEMILEPLRALAAQPLNPTIRAYNKATGKSVKEMEPHMWGGSADTDKVIAKEYAKYAAGLAVIYAAASQIPGVEIESDPHSSDFGVLRIGDTRLDMLSGFKQVAVLMAKTSPKFMGGGKIKSLKTGEHKEMGASDWIRTVSQFGRSKLSPLTGTALNLMLGEDLVGDAVKPLRSQRTLRIFQRTSSRP
jgi:hypothetical protein